VFSNPKRRASEIFPTSGSTPGHSAEDGAEDENVVGRTASPAGSVFRFFKRGRLLILRLVGDPKISDSHKVYYGIYSGDVFA
jgi:hypothetical protein